MAVKNRTCLACSTKYSFCPDCNGADKIAPSWKSDFCSKDCMTLWTTATKYNMGKLTKPEAKAIISALTLKPIDQYVKCVQRDLGVILKEEPKPKSKRVKRAELSVIDEAIPEAFEVALDAKIKSITNDSVEVEVAVPVIKYDTIVYKTENNLHEVVTTEEE